MKKTHLLGMIIQLVLAAVALSCLIIASVYENVALIIASAVVLLALLYIAGGSLVAHLAPKFNYFGWVVWFCKVFCVKWVWQTFCLGWFWPVFCKAWVWDTFCVKWVWQTFCVKWVYQKFDKWKGWLYLSPAIVLILVFTGWPIVNTLRMAFLENYDTMYELGGYTFNVGFGNFTKVISYKGFVNCLENTMILCVLTVPISTILALLIAVCLNSIKFLNRFLQTVFFLPYVTNSIAIGMVFAAMFNMVGSAFGGENEVIVTAGIINNVIEFFGGNPINWINEGSEKWANMFVMVVYIVWNALPFKILILLGGLQSVNKQYYDAAKIDSTPRWRVFSRITVPLLSPMIAYVVITGFIGGFKEYSSIVGIFGDDMGPTGDPRRLNTMVGFIYNYISERQGRASAAALILFGIIFAVTMVNLYVSKKKTHY